MREHDGLPHTLFTTTEAQGEDRFEQWRSSISVIFDVAPLGRQDLDGFQAQVRATHLGNLLIGDIGFGTQQFGRSSHRVARDGLDHYLVQWYRSGGFVGQADDEEIEVGGGDVVMFDLARTQRTWAQPSEVLSLILPRELIDEAMPRTEGLHGTVLKAGNVFADLLSDHLQSLNRRLPGLPLQDAPAVARATTQMIAACMRPGQRTVSEARTAMLGVTLERVQQYIGKHLSSDLSPEKLSNGFGVSRTLLYQLFEPLGGVSRYIQQRRLQRAFHALTQPGNRRLRISEIAARTGFASEAHFSRAFRTAFGATPTDVRATAMAVHDMAAGSGDGGTSTALYAEWVRHLQPA